MTLTQRDYQSFEEGTGFGDWCGNLLLKVFPDSFNTEDIVDVSFAMEMSIRFEQLKVEIDDYNNSSTELKDAFILQKVLQPRTTSVLNYLQQFSSPIEAIKSLTEDTRDTDTIFPATY